MTGGANVSEHLDTIRVRMPEGAVFSHRLASPALRMLALAIDWMIVSAGWGIVSVLIGALPFAYFVGGTAALLNRRGQRLGDMAAGTLVIWEAAEPVPDLDLLRGGKYNTLRAHAPAVARCARRFRRTRRVWRGGLLRGATGIDDAARVELFAELAAHFKSLSAFPDGAVEGVSDEQFVRNVVDVLFVERRVKIERAGKTQLGHLEGELNRLESI